MGEVGRERAERLHWSSAVDGFAEVTEEAIARAGRRSADAQLVRQRSRS
jgi:hypothetical protein